MKTGVKTRLKDDNPAKTKAEATYEDDDDDDDDGDDEEDGDDDDNGDDEAVKGAIILCEKSGVAL